MKAIILLLLCTAALLAQPQPAAPQNLIVTATTTTTAHPVGSLIPVPVVTGSNNPLGNNHQGLAAYWFAPDTNQWTGEWSTNGVDWTTLGNQWSKIAPRAERAIPFNPYNHGGGPAFQGWSYAEAPLDWASRWSVRIRRVR